LSAFAVAHPIFVVDKVGLLLPGLFGGVRLEFVRVGALKVGVLIRMLVGLLWLDRSSSLGSLIILSSVSFVETGDVAPFVGVVAEYVRVP